MKVQIATLNEVAGWIRNETASANKILVVYGHYSLAPANTYYVGALRKEPLLEGVEVLTAWNIDTQHNNEKDPLSEARVLEIYWQAAQKNMSGNQVFSNVVGYILTGNDGAKKLLWGNYHSGFRYMDTLESESSDVLWRDEADEAYTLDSVIRDFFKAIGAAMPDIVAEKEATATETYKFDNWRFQSMLNDYVLTGKMGVEPLELEKSEERTQMLDATLCRWDVITQYLRKESVACGSGKRYIVDLAMKTPYLQDAVLRMAQLRVTVKAEVERYRRERPDTYKHWMLRKKIYDIIASESWKYDFSITAKVRVKETYDGCEKIVTKTFPCPETAVTCLQLDTNGFHEDDLTQEMQREHRYIRFDVEDILTITRRIKGLPLSEARIVYRKGRA